MKQGSNENLLNTWTETQQYFSQNFFNVLPRLPTGLEGWRDAYLQQLAGWETLVKQALQTETAWVEQWAGKAVGGPPETGALVSTWGRQMEGLLRQWLSIQAQVWDEFFEVLRHGGIALAPVTFDSDTDVSSVKAVPGPTTAECVSSAAKPVAAQAVTETAAPPIAPATEPDDLTLIAGIGVSTAQKLQTAGIINYRQLATLDGEEIERLEATIKRPGRIRRDRWIEQARELHWQKYQEKL